MARAPKHLVVISFGAIGDALMLLALLDAAHEANPALSCHFFTARDGSLPKALGTEYGFVRFSNLKTVSGILDFISLVCSRNTVLVPPSFGTIPLHVKLFALMLSRMPGSHSVGFKDRSGFDPYHEVRIYDTDAMFYENIRDALATNLAVRPGAPRYLAHPIPELLPRLRLSERRYVIIHPFAANPKRGLPARRFRGLVRHLSDAYPQMNVVITGGKGDAKIAEAIARDEARSFAGTLSLPETAALIKDAALFIGVDTGITHLASLMRVPSVVIANRSNPSWLPRYNPRARILTKDGPCGCTGDKQGICKIVEDGQEYFRCAYDITDDAITAAIPQALASGEVSA